MAIDLKFKNVKVILPKIKVGRKKENVEHEKGQKKPVSKTGQDGLYNEVQIVVGKGV